MSSSQAIRGLSFINVATSAFDFWHVPHDIVLKDQRSWREDREMHYGDSVATFVWGVNVFLFFFFIPILWLFCSIFFYTVCFGTNHLFICLTVRPMLWRTCFPCQCTVAFKIWAKLISTAVMKLMHTCVWFYYYISLHGYG